MTNTIDDRFVEKAKENQAEIETTAKEIAYTLRHYGHGLKLDYIKRLEDIGTKSHHGSKDETAQLVYVPEGDLIKGKFKVENFWFPRGGIYSVVESSKHSTSKSCNVHLSLDNLSWMSQLLDLKRLKLFVDYQIPFDGITKIVSNLITDLSKRKDIVFAEVPVGNKTYSFKFSLEEKYDRFWKEWIPGHRVSFSISDCSLGYVILHKNWQKGLSQLIDAGFGVREGSTAKPEELVYATSRANEFLSTLKERYGTKNRAHAT